MTVGGVEATEGASSDNHYGSLVTFLSFAFSHSVPLVCLLRTTDLGVSKSQSPSDDENGERGFA